MKLKEVKAEVAAMEAAPQDDEGNHGREDALYERVLRAIAEGKTNTPRALARAALRTKELKFERWCA